MPGKELDVLALPTKAPFDDIQYRQKYLSSNKYNEVTGILFLTINDDQFSFFEENAHYRTEWQYVENNKIYRPALTGKHISNHHFTSLSSLVTIYLTDFLKVLLEINPNTEEGLQIQPFNYEHISSFEIRRRYGNVWSVNFFPLNSGTFWFSDNTIEFEVNNRLWPVRGAIVKTFHNIVMKSMSRVADICDIENRYNGVQLQKIRDEVDRPGWHHEDYSSIPFDAMVHQYPQLNDYINQACQDAINEIANDLPQPGTANATTSKAVDERMEGEEQWV